MQMVCCYSMYKLNQHVSHLVTIKINLKKICCLQETYLIEKDIHKLKVKGWEKTYHAHGPSKKAGVSILISDKVDFKPKLV